MELELVPVGGEFLAVEAAAPAAPAVQPGTCLVIFRYSRLSAGDLTRVTVLDPNGRELPLLIEPLFMEFGRIADARMAFVLKEAEAGVGRGPFTLKWGPEVQGGNNSRIEKLAADPAIRERYRSLRLRGGSGRDEGNIARLEVIADSTAEYHFLWYLLPMSMVFALLLFRKLSGRGETDSISP